MDTLRWVRFAALLVVYWGLIAVAALAPDKPSTVAQAEPSASAQSR